MDWFPLLNSLRCHIAPLDADVQQGPRIDLARAKAKPAPDQVLPAKPCTPRHGSPPLASRARPIIPQEVPCAGWFPLCNSLRIAAILLD